MYFSEYFAKTIGIKLIDIFRKTNTKKLYNEYKNTEYYSLDELKKLQFKKLKKLLIHCEKNVPYYSQLFNRYSFNPQKFQNVSDLKILPPLTKEIVKENFTKLKSSNFLKYVPRIKETGGSTGEPLKIYHDKCSHGAMWANIYKGFGHAGYLIGNRYIILAHGSMLPKRINYSKTLYYLFQNAKIFPCYHLTQEDIKKFITLIKTSKAKFIYGYSSTLFQVARFLKNQPNDFTKLEGIFTTADMLYSKQRKLIETQFGVPVFDNYGCPEAGVMTWECNQHDGYHYNMESAFIEIINKNEEGAGNILSTNLTNYAFPIVRYDTGDVGNLKEDNCLCGRAHTKIISLLGRQRDIITLKDGRMIHGAFFNHLPSFYDERIKRFQIIQPDIDNLEVHIDIDPKAKLKDFSPIIETLEKAFNFQLNIVLIDGDFRESKISKKHRSVISEVDNIWVT